MRYGGWNVYHVNDNKAVMEFIAATPAIYVDNQI